MDLRDRLLQILADFERQLQVLLDSFPEAEKRRAGQADNWAPKDVLVHVAYWQRNLVGRLCGQETRSYGDGEIDGENRRIYELNKQRGWEDITAELLEADREIYRTVEGLTGAELEVNEHPGWPGHSDQPLWQRILDYATVHPLTHYVSLYTALGYHQEAVNWQETFFRELLAMDASPRWRGRNLYNLACTLALAGEAERAIATLLEALKCSPELIEWSKQDSDLDSIRADGRIQALYGKHE